jgi:hypothetical protein
MTKVYGKNLSFSALRFFNEPFFMEIQDIMQNFIHL